MNAALALMIEEMSTDMKLPEALRHWQSPAKLRTHEQANAPDVDNEVTTIRKS